MKLDFSRRESYFSGSKFSGIDRYGKCKPSCPFHSSLVWNWQPQFAIHTKDFADYTQSENGQLCLFKGACTMAFTAHDVMISPEIQEQILKEFLCQ